jgi:osmoprotectant transport system permease protein
MKFPERLARAPRKYAQAIAFGALFLWSVFRFSDVELLLSPFVTGKGVFTERDPLPALALQHVLLSFGSALASFAIAFPLGLYASGPTKARARDLIERAATFGETFPTAALIALLVPSLGYGYAPVALALVAYGALPILRNTLSGLDGASADAIDAARGLGMTDAQALLRVRLPGAAPLILEGVRVALVIDVAAATIGAAVGSGGFGVPIVSGLRSFDALLVLKGALPVAFLALAADGLVKELAASLPWVVEPRGAGSKGGGPGKRG